MSIAAPHKKAEAKTGGGHRRSAVPGATTDLTTPVEGNLIQRKSSCACGGGCPKCLGTIGIQAKLRIGAPNDVYEQEADRIADQVMRMTEPKVQKTSQANTNSNGTNTRLLVSKADVPIQRQEEPKQE